MAKYPTKFGQGFVRLYEDFMKASENGSRTKTQLRRVSRSTLKNQRFLLKLIIEFCKRKKINLKIRTHTIRNQSRRQQEVKQWRNFYIDFLEFLYEDKGHFDSYVGSLVKILRTFFNYLHTELMYPLGEFYKGFAVPKDHIQVIALSPEQFCLLAHSKRFKHRLPEHLKRINDMFVFGSTVGLRISDLFTLGPEHFKCISRNMFLEKTHQKTGETILVPLPEHCKHIYLKYVSKSPRLFPYHTLDQFNKGVRSIAEMAGWKQTARKFRRRRGKLTPVFKDRVRDRDFRFCDLLSSHTMRRTAVTVMLSLGMKEHVVKQITGHSHRSVSFERYISYSQALTNKEMLRVHNKLRMGRYS